MLRPGFATAASLSVSPHEQGSAAGTLIGTGAAGHVLSPLIAMPLYMVWTPGPFVMTTLLMAFLIALRAHGAEDSRRHRPTAQAVSERESAFH